MSIKEIQMKKSKSRVKVNLCPQCGNVVPIGDRRYKDFTCKRCKYVIKPEEELIKEFRDEVEN